MLETNGNGRAREANKRTNNKPSDFNQISTLKIVLLFALRLFIGWKEANDNLNAEKESENNTNRTSHYTIL